MSFKCAKPQEIQFYVFRYDKEIIIIVATELKSFLYLKYAFEFWIYRLRIKSLLESELELHLNEHHLNYDDNKKYCFKKQKKFVRKKS